MIPKKVLKHKELVIEVLHHLLEQPINSPVQYNQFRGSGLCFLLTEIIADANYSNDPYSFKNWDELISEMYDWIDTCGYIDGWSNRGYLTEGRKEKIKELLQDLSPQEKAADQ